MITDKYHFILRVTTSKNRYLKKKYRWKRDQSFVKSCPTTMVEGQRGFNCLLGVYCSPDLTDKMKRSFFQAVVVSILLYGCTTWTLTKRLKKKLNDNYTRMLQAILNKSWRQHPTRHQLYGHLPPITKTIQVRLYTPMNPRIWPSKSRTTSSNIHTVAMWGYGMWPWRPVRGDEW